MNSKIITGILLVFSFNACDFLEEEPIGLPELGDFYDNINELQLGLNGVYGVLTNSRFQLTYAYIGSGCSDNMVAVEAERLSERANLFRLDVTPQDPFLEDFWFQNYLGIFRANLLIQSAQNVRTFVPEGTNVQAGNDIENSKQLVREIVGQAKVLRAFYYFNLVRTFGGVPIKDNVLFVDGNDDNLVQPRATKEEVYELIEKDLREAVVGLTGPGLRVVGDVFNDRGGRVDRGTALSLLLKVLIYQAQPGQLSAKWQDALEISTHLVERPTDAFTVNQMLQFDELYQANTEELERVKVDLVLEELSNEELLNSNSVRGVRIGLGTAYNLDFNYAFLNQEQADFTGGSVFEVNHTIAPDGSVNLFSPFHDEIDQSNTLQPLIEMLNDYPNDPRAAISVMVSGTTLIDGTGVANPPFPEKTACFKWYTLNTERKRIKNFRIMRYAEVVLFHAEALNETGNQIRAVETLNLLRERARRIGESGDPRVTGTSLPVDYGLSNYITTRDRIRIDRRIELCFEFDRFWDIVRSGTIAANMDRFNSLVESDYQKNYREGISEVFPIPLQEIDASRGVVIQNPGY